MFSLTRFDTGRYFYPLNYDTIIFPSNYIGVDFDVVVFTDNGLEFEVEVGFYYKLPRENVGKIYDAFSKNYGGKRISKIKIRLTCYFLFIRLGEN